MKKTVRHQAVEILTHISQSNAFAGDLLDFCLEKQSLSRTADGRLLTHLVYGVLRMRGHLDWILARLYRGNYSKMEENIKNVLRTGLYQLRFSDRLPAFAVVDEAVKIAGRVHSRAGGLVNAVLRSYLRGPDLCSFPDENANPAEYIAAYHSHPLWLVKGWLDLYGRKDTEALCAADNEMPPLTVRVNPLKSGRRGLTEKLIQAGFQAEETPWSPEGIHIAFAPLPVQKTVFFADGLLRIQDEASQLISYLVNPRKGQKILDVCAGSGGKTTHLAALMKNEGRMVAMDRNLEKIEQLQNDASRMGIRIIEAIRADGELPLSSEYHNQFDAVFVDAPCSGTGTLRRNPEIKWRLQPGDIDRHAGTQNSILRNAAAAVAPHGILVYATCSLLPRENDGVVRQFLADCPHFRLGPPDSPAVLNLTDPNGILRTYPHRHSMDGFFGAVFRRRI